MSGVAALTIMFSVAYGKSVNSGTKRMTSESGNHAKLRLSMTSSLSSSDKYHMVPHVPVLQRIALPWSIASQAFLQACCEIGGKRLYLLLEGVGVMGQTFFITSWIFLILLACPPCWEVGQGRVVEAEDFGIDFAVGVAALPENPRPPLRPVEDVPEDEGPSEGGKCPSIKAFI